MSDRFMICCDNCEEWLHGDCVSITKEIGKEMEKNGIEYICPRCVIGKTLCITKQTSGYHFEIF